jgi:L-lactate dehydrogenase
MLRDERRVLTVSTVQQDNAFEGIALSLPAVVSGSGVDQIIIPELDADESEALDHSAEVLREAFVSIDL